MASPPRLLIVSGHSQRALELGLAFERAGAAPQVLTSIAALSGFLAESSAPELIIAEVEPESAEFSELESVIRLEPSRAFTPVALLAAQRDFAPFTSQLRSGVVAIWEKSIAPSTLVQRAFMLLAELPSRRGEARAGLFTAERALLWRFLRSTRRTGALRLGPERSGDGTALLAGGELQEARAGELTGIEALRAILANTREPLTFCEVSGFPGAGAGVVMRIDSPDDALAFLFGEPIDELPRAIPLLLVDDDPELCRMFGTLFRKHGFDVTVANDGLEGFRKACSAPFSLVIADLNMPRMDGWGLLRLLREDIRTRELPVAFLSCHDDYRESLKALNSGAQAYFSKSIRLDSLASHVRAMLEPAEKLSRQLSRGQPTALPLMPLGIQTVLRILASLRLTGLVEAKDTFGSYQLVLEDGAPKHATAQSGRHVSQGEQAFAALVASQPAQGHFTPGPSFVAPSISGSMEEHLERAQLSLNEREKQARETTLIDARHVEIDRELYEVYSQVGPRGWLETARLICEERLAPREVIGRVELSPIEVEETIRDLVRRGVVTLRT